MAQEIIQKASSEWWTFKCFSLSTDSLGPGLKNNNCRALCIRSVVLGYQWDTDNFLILCQLHLTGAVWYEEGCKERCCSWILN